MSREELRMYLVAWMDSRAERQRLERLPPSPAIDQLCERARADEECDRANYFRQREEYRKDSGAA